MSRLVRLTTVQVVRPEWDKGTVEQNIEQACRWLEVAGAQKPDIVCLPEDVVGMCVPPDLAPQSVPGPATERFSRLASKHRMYVIAPLIERGEDGIYGAALLIDRQGSIVGTYRKVHATTVARGRGHSAGDRFPVFETDFGKIGIMICYDNFFPETARILALNGAEILFFPTAGDGRGPMAFEVTVRARAIDNCVPVVASVYQNQGRSCIVSAQGYLLADSCEIPGVVTADVDLDEKITRHEVSGGIGDLKEILLKARRPETYRRIIES